jgi:hypothetical protein
MKVLARNEAIGSQNVFPGDTLIAMLDDREVGRHEITEAFVFDTLLIVKPEPGELGLSDGIGAIFGKKETT